MSRRTAGPSTALRFGRDDKGRGVAKVAWFAGWREPQVPPLRYASVGMTIL
jgi:hypothetical protein